MRHSHRCRHQTITHKVMHLRAYRQWAMVHNANTRTAIGTINPIDKTIAIDTTTNIQIDTVARRIINSSSCSNRKPIDMNDRLHTNEMTIVKTIKIIAAMGTIIVIRCIINR